MNSGRKNVVFAVVAAVALMLTGTAFGMDAQYKDAAGIQARTTGSSVGLPSKSRGITLAAVSLAGTSKEILKVDPKSDVKDHLLRRGPNFPQSEHRFAPCANPVERHLALIEDLRKLESQNISIE